MNPLTPFGAILISFFGTILIFVGLMAVVYVSVGEHEISAGYGFWTAIGTFILCFVIAAAAGMK